MPRIFISYRRKPSAMLATLIAKDLEKRGVTSFVDTRRTDGGGPFPDRLLRAIDEADVFVCLLDEKTLESEWVRTEINYAYDQKKPMIPVFQEGYIPSDSPLDESIKTLLQSDGIYVLDVKNLYIDQAIADLARMVKQTRTEKVPLPAERQRRSILISGLVGVLVVVSLLAVILVSNGLLPPGTATPTIKGISVSDLNSPSPSPTLSETEFKLTAQGEMAVQTQNAAQTQAAAVAFDQGTANALTVTAEARMHTSTPDAPATAARLTETQAAIVAATQTAILLATQAALDQTATADAWTDTPTPTNTPLPGYPGGEPITANDQWTPIIQEIDGIEMALVPIGCFDMGSENGAEDERPVSRQCFTEPFWIDRYEVTNEQFRNLGGVAAQAGDWDDLDQPRDSVSWFEARDFCEKHGARLPTEAEWEYAARGPDNLVYPWGNEFLSENVVYNTNRTLPVGSKPSGVSWVGSYDLIGNVREWVNSIYLPYPYNVKGGREADNVDGPRVLRGGSWFSPEIELFASARKFRVPTGWSYYIGFRCARDD